MQGPVRITGPSTINGRLFLFPTYPSYGNARDQYLTHLNSMRSAGRGDFRPFSGPLGIALIRQDANTLNHLQVKLALSTSDTSLAPITAPLTHPNVIAGYQLYPGGMTYHAKTAAGRLRLQPVEPDAGSRSGHESSRPVSQQRRSVDSEQRPHHGHHCHRQLVAGNPDLWHERPAGGGFAAKARIFQSDLAVACRPGQDDLRINGGSNSQIKGSAVVWDDFEIKQGAPTTQFTLTGSIASAGVILRGRDNWIMTANDWQDDYDDFNGNGLLAVLLDALLNTIRSTLGLPGGATVYFPEFMQHQRGFTVQPTLTIQPDSSGVLPHWQDWTRPIYRKRPERSGIAVEPCPL